MIMDGWGVKEPSKANAISLAKKNNFDQWLNTYPAMVLQAAGEAVGLSWGEMGNSEVGHLSLGSGRIIYQSLPRITRAISDSSFFKNQAFLHFILIFYSPLFSEVVGDGLKFFIYFSLFYKSGSFAWKGFSTI